jgi:hypothetical protein
MKAMFQQPLSKLKESLSLRKGASSGSLAFSPRRARQIFFDMKEKRDASHHMWGLMHSLSAQAEKMKDPPTVSMVFKALEMTFHGKYKSFSSEYEFDNSWTIDFSKYNFRTYPGKSIGKFSIPINYRSESRRLAKELNAVFNKNLEIQITQMGGKKGKYPDVSSLYADPFASSILYPKV